MSFTIISTLLVALAGIHLSGATKDYIEAEFFHVGMTARAIYTAPGDGRTTINLEDANGGVVLHMDYRFEWVETQHRTTLGGHFGSQLKTIQWSLGHRTACQ